MFSVHFSVCCSLILSLISLLSEAIWLALCLFGVPGVVVCLRMLLRCLMSFATSGE